MEIGWVDVLKQHFVYSCHPFCRAQTKHDCLAQSGIKSKSLMDYVSRLVV